MSPANPVAYAYDDIFLAHDLPSHPENAGRLVAIMSTLAESGLAAKMLRLDVTPADRATLERVHTPRYLDWLRAQSNRPTHLVDRDTYVSPGSYEAALSAVGAAIRCARAVLSGEAGSAVALVRPPGHHARPDQAMGFCLLNNIAGAAAWALAKGGLDRVLIFDFDAHHGNGTQEIFANDPRVLYVSVHQYDWSFFPGTGSSAERGTGPGQGYTINVPLPPGSGDDSYLAVVDTILRPQAIRFRPQLILVSAGYDPHWREPLTSLNVTLSGLTTITQRLVALAEELCQGRIAFFLEGGYDREVLSLSVVNLVLVLLGQSHLAQDPIGPPPVPPRDDLESIEELARVLDAR